MGVVYRARRADLDRVVALKVLLKPGETQARRFLREGRALAKLEHANVVRVLDVGEENGEHFLHRCRPCRSQFQR